MPIIKTNPNTLLAASPKRSWLKASEALPPVGKKVLCVHQSGSLFVGTCRPSAEKPAGYAWALFAVGVDGAVTHWREL